MRPAPYCFALSLALLASSCAGTRHAGSIGVAQLSDDYAPLDDQLTLGWSMHPNHEESGIGYEVGAQLGGAYDEVAGVDVTAASFELYGGPRYELVLDSVRPWIAGGLSLLGTSVEGEQGFVVVRDDDTTLGLYLGGGVDFDLSEQLFLGLGARRTFSHDQELFGIEADGEFTQFFLRFGLAL